MDEDRRADGERQLPSFESVYATYFPFVWRSARRLGVPEASLEDVAQDVFVVVVRRLGDYEARSALRTWIYAILLRVVRDHRRTVRRKRLGNDDRVNDDALLDLPSSTPSPHEATLRRDASRTLQLLLDGMDEDKREVFVLAELEELTAPEIAVATGVPVNTVYSRLRAARRAFDEALAIHRAHEALPLDAPRRDPGPAPPGKRWWPWSASRATKVAITDRRPAIGGSALSSDSSSNLLFRSTTPRPPVEGPDPTSGRGSTS